MNDLEGRQLMAGLLLAAIASALLALEVLAVAKMFAFPY